MSGSPRSYPLIEEDELRDTTPRLDLSPLCRPYVFSFGWAARADMRSTRSARPTRCGHLGRYIDFTVW